MQAAIQKPVSGPSPEAYWQRLMIVKHPALRLGYLDARVGRTVDHDTILSRIEAETPPRALNELRTAWLAHIIEDVSLAQYRYEEGRRIWTDCRIQVRGWSDPRFPPAGVLDLCRHGPAGSPEPPAPETMPA